MMKITLPLRITLVLLPLLMLMGAAVVSAHSTQAVTTDVSGTRTSMMITTTGATGNEAVVYYLFDKANVFTPTWSTVTTGTYSTVINTTSWTPYWQSAKVMAGGPQTVTVDAASDFEVVQWAPEFWGPKTPYTRTTVLSGTLTAMALTIEGAYGNERVAVYVGDTQSWYTPTWQATGVIGEYTATVNTTIDFPDNWQSAKIDQRGPQELVIEPTSDFYAIDWAPSFWAPKPNAALKNRVYLPVVCN